MKILAIDTTSEFGSLAVRVDDETKAELSLQSRDGFGHLLFPAIEEVLAGARLRLQDVDCFAGATGPGAFTGVRLDLAAVKGLAEATGKPAVGVSNLRALSTFGSHENRAVVLDARRTEIFGAVYDAEMRALSPEIVMKFSAWLATLDLSEYEFISHDLSLLRPVFEGTRFAEMPLTEAPRPLAAAIAQCAMADGQCGLWTDPAALDA
ncbi:MAG: tRNA (adenosine(37)-N6)-threonylcarbamoyltransferase complex dimerization subunit type 1 TsaB, partial [Acidobacteriota bacterium]|nr:tRNA (adenosine(37)-N6)-threonylcarbamoyltransferase complex dimerization subunit type 1 TsaB [Acidobacteriota bacterium]